jgi:hypothetical protein
LPLKDYRYKNISISLYTMKTISIRGINQFGKSNPVGASIPFELIESIYCILCDSNIMGG